MQEKPEKVNDDEVDMLRYLAFSARKWLKFDVPVAEREEVAA